MDDLYAKALGDYILYDLKVLTTDHLLHLMETNAVFLVEQIKLILDNRELDDPTCCRRIDAIIKQFHANGLDTPRHRDW